jgi:HSP20 family molecular chaperone IbpA
MIFLRHSYPSPFWAYNSTHSTSYKREIKEDSIEVTIELPGVDKEEIALDYLSEKLSVNITIESKNINNDIYLANQVDPEAITAKLDKGVLTITAPIKNDNRRIKIE